MVSAYVDFILEKRIIDLLIEGNLSASEKFLGRLSSIKNRNAIADKLYQAFHSKKHIDKDLLQNWVDITDKEDAVTFISDRSAKRLTDQDPGVNIFAARGRNEIKVGRLARAVLSEIGVTVIDREVEEFVNLYKSSNVDNSKRFLLVSGDDIAKYYDYHNYENQNGTLGGSCMKAVSASYLDIYSKNPQCQLLVYLSESGKVLGRAVIWKISKLELDSECAAEYLMDRVYTSSDSDLIKFKDYAEEVGWLYKYVMNSDYIYGTIFKFKGKNLYGRVISELNKTDFKKYPYVDTMRFIDVDAKLVSNVGFDTKSARIMGDTGGSLVSCGGCGGRGYNIYSNRCPECNGHGIYNCRVCGGRGGILCSHCGGTSQLKCDGCAAAGRIPCSCAHGRILCKTCRGRGNANCTNCSGTGRLGPCVKCSATGKEKCDGCDGKKELSCPKCSGEGRYSRTWGKNRDGSPRYRTVACSKCSSTGKLKCRKCYEYIQLPGQNWPSYQSTGKMRCSGCNGYKKAPCPVCNTQNTSYAGKVSCADCRGRGGTLCSNCRGMGSIICDKCKGERYLGECPHCVDGKASDCTNDRCEEGKIRCLSCKGTGTLSGNKPPCDSCTGILRRAEAAIKNGSIKLK